MDGRTYGFSRDDARDLLSVIGRTESEIPGRRPSGGGGGGGDPGDRLFGFELAADMTGRSAAADIYELDGSSFGSMIESETLYDPAGWLAGAETGQVGICYYQGGRYYAMQAACPPPEI